MNIKQAACAVLFSLSLVPATTFAQVVIRVGPPPPVVERRPPPPERRGYVWVDGYQRWDGHRYNWAPGRWDRPPRSGQRWVAGRWTKHRGEWVFVEGRWR